MKIIFLLCLMTISSLLLAEASEAFPEPIFYEAVETNRKKPDESYLLRSIFGYQKYISPVIGGGRCPMYPSCSGYGVEAVNEHGALMGWILTCDRLMRCGRDEMNHSPRIRDGNDHLCYDPVSTNDFWLKKRHD